MVMNPATAPMPAPAVTPDQCVNEDDVIAATEAAIRDVANANIEQTLRLAANLLSRGGRAAVRGVHLMEVFAHLHGKMISLLGQQPPRRRRNMIGSYYSSDGAVDAALAGPMVGGTLYQGDTETFGNQALQQLVAIVQPLISSQLTMAKAKASDANSVEINNLTTALATAKQAGLPPAVLDSLTARLTAALAAPPAAPELGVGEPEPDEEPDGPEEDPT
jgi:hypothetical protein